MTKKSRNYTLKTNTPT